MGVSFLILKIISFSDKFCLSEELMIVLVLVLVGVFVQESAQLCRWEGYVDWRKRPAERGRHGGMIAASFDLGMLYELGFFFFFSEI